MQPKVNVKRSFNSSIQFLFQERTVKAILYPRVTAAELVKTEGVKSQWEPQLPVLATSSKPSTGMCTYDIVF